MDIDGGEPLVELLWGLALGLVVLPAACSRAE